MFFKSCKKIISSENLEKIYKKPLATLNFNQFLHVKLHFLPEG